MNGRIKTTAVLGTALLSFGCADAGDSPNPVAPDESTAASIDAAVAPEKAALAELTHAFALALQDAGLRQRIKNDLRASRHTTEHKLQFSNYLHGNSGGILLAKMVKETGKSREETEALLEAVRPLEFYMPVQEHRETWRGGDELLVASLLEDHTVPFGYTLEGAPLLLDAEEAPSTPALVLVPIETDFSRALAPDVPNKNDQNGETIGTYCTTCRDDDGSGGGGTSSKPGGLYMTYSYLRNDGEAWAKGDPEIEVHIHGPNSGDKTYGADLACAGDRVKESYRNFNQDSRTWSGEVLLFTQAQINNFNSQYSEGWNVMLWEDDDGACSIKTDKNLTQALTLIAGAATAAGIRGISPPGIPRPVPSLRGYTRVQVG